MGNKKNVLSLKKMKENGDKIAMISVYDYAFASIAKTAEPDAILVGDSLQMVLYGSDSTVEGELDTMIRHCRAVRKAAPDTFIIGDMPFGSFQISNESAVENAAAMVKYGGCDAVKLEGGAVMADRISAIVRAGIPVCAHIGLTIQRSSQLGGYRIQGKGNNAANVVEDCKAVENAGAFMTVLECVPEKLGTYISEHTKIPVIGIGSGAGTDGQILVFHDLFNLAADFNAKLAKVYKDLKTEMVEGVREYVKDVRAVKFPTEENWFDGVSEQDIENLEY